MIRELKFEMICRRHSDEIYRYARSMAGDPSDAEDIVQEALLKLWRDIGDVRLGGARAWLYRTTRNLCIDQARRRAHCASPSYPGDQVLHELRDRDLETIASDQDPEDMSRRIDAALQRLNELQRSVIVMYEINGLKYREIAGQLEIPLNSVKVHLSRARKRLQSLLKDQAAWIDA